LKDLSQVEPIESLEEAKAPFMKSRELALLSVFSALWIAAQLTLGPVLGRFSIGPISLHGSVNRVVGWMLMVIFADLSGEFGRVSLMALIASLTTRIIRLSPLTGLVTGAGYALGGLAFDAMYFGWYGWKPSSRSGKTFLLVVSIISGTLAMVPYIILKFSMLNIEAFLALIPLYAISMLKGTLFSVAGTSVGLSIIPRLKSRV
jgi:hypothetical protein